MKKEYSNQLKTADAVIKFDVIHEKNNNANFTATREIS